MPIFSCGTYHLCASRDQILIHAADRRHCLRTLKTASRLLSHNLFHRRILFHRLGTFDCRHLWVFSPSSSHVYKSSISVLHGFLPLYPSFFLISALRMLFPGFVTDHATLCAVQNMIFVYLAMWVHVCLNTTRRPHDLCSKTYEPCHMAQGPLMCRRQRGPAVQ